MTTFGITTPRIMTLSTTIKEIEIVRMTHSVVELGIMSNQQNDNQHSNDQNNKKCCDNQQNDTQNNDTRHRKKCDISKLTLSITTISIS